MRITESRLRRIIRSVILESVSVNRLPEGIDDDLLRDLVYGVSSIFQSENVEEIGSEIQSRAKGYLSHLADKKEYYIKEINKCLDEDLVDSIFSIYTISKEAFRVLGFSESDIKRICEYNSGLNDDSSYDYHTGVDIYVTKDDKFVFTLEH